MSARLGSSEENDEDCGDQADGGRSDDGKHPLEHAHLSPEHCKVDALISKFLAQAGEVLAQISELAPQTSKLASEIGNLAAQLQSELLKVALGRHDDRQAIDNPLERTARGASLTRRDSFVHQVLLVIRVHRIRYGCFRLGFVSVATVPYSPLLRACSVYLYPRRRVDFTILVRCRTG